MRLLTACTTAAVGRVVKAFAGVEAALSSARPATGWTPDALAGLREGLFGSRQQEPDAKPFSIEK